MVLVALCVGVLGVAPIAAAAAGQRAAPSTSITAPVAPHAATGPKVASLSVSTLNRDESMTATIRGSGFVSGAKVSLGKGVTADVKSLSATEISVRLDVAHDAGTGARTLTVTNPGGDKGTLSHALAVDYAPVLARRAVGDGAVDWTTSMVRPDFFVTPTLSFSGTGVSIASETLAKGGQLDISFSIASFAAAGWRTMRITEGSASWTVPDGLKVRLPPIVTDVAPLGQGAADQTLRVTGSNFEVCKSKEPGVAISGTGVIVDNVSAALGNLMYVKLTVAPTAALGPRDVTVTNCDSGGVATSPGVFHVVGPPTITSIPAIAIGVRRSEIIRGANLTPATTFTAAGSGIVFSHLDWLSSTKFMATIAASASAVIGSRDVTASDTGGGSTLNTGVLSIDPLPTETSTGPKGIGANTAILLTVNGTGFEKGATVSFETAGARDGALELSPAVVQSPTRLRIVVAATSATTHAAPIITITNPDGGVVSTLAFPTDAAPVLNVVSSTTTQGALVVNFTRPVGAPATEAYDVVACINAAMTAKCLRVNGFKSGHLLGGLISGDRYYTVVTALAGIGYFVAKSRPVGPYRATALLQTPVITKLAATTSSLSISFTGSSNAPKGQAYTAKACLDAAMTTGCVVRSNYLSGATFTGVHKAKYYVRIFAVSSPGYLASDSKIVAT